MIGEGLVRLLPGPARRRRAQAGSAWVALDKDRKKEIGRDLLAKMCRDLKIDPYDP
jgi:hypothetical protein